ncbi:MAG: class I SAM-dependent methyltransferase [Oligoflexus sp.]
MSHDFWNERYRQAEHLYSDQANEFLKDFFTKQGQKGEVLVPGDGDGRNGLWLARQGFSVSAVDYSEVAVAKGMQRAQREGLAYHSQAQSVENWQPEENRYDYAALIFLHLPKDLMQQTLDKILVALRPGASLIIEVFSQDQLQRSSGGPKDLGLLYQTLDFEKLKAHFARHRLEQRDCYLQEGPLHTGDASVINFIGYDLQK